MNATSPSQVPVPGALDEDLPSSPRARPQALGAEGALARATERLLSLQDRQGWWRGELETNVTMDAEDLLLREFLGIRGERETHLAANWIRSQQRDDGSWAVFHGGDGDLSTTIEAYTALRLAGDSSGADHMGSARTFILAHGGIERARVFTRIWLALFDLWPWDELPALPPEIMFFPSWVPFNIYDFACWARQTVVPLSVVMAMRPRRPLDFGLDELRVGARPAAPRRGLRTRARRMALLDSAARLYGKAAPRVVRRAALRRAERWILARQEADGSWGGIQPPWVYSLLALQLLGYETDHPVMRAGLDGLERFLVHDRDVRRLEACQSPVWDTALAIIALADAGVPADDSALVRAADWLLGEEVRVPGDWAVRRPHVPPGGWAFEFANDNYPDLDDTAEVILALRRVVHPQPDRVEAAIARGLAWALGMQSADDGWASFDADNTRGSLRELPFSDFGEVIDPPSADVTAHVIEMLAREGHGSQPAVKGGLLRLSDWQEADGSWFGRWGVNHTYGTSAVLLALEAAGVPRDDPRVRRAVRWLEDHQNADGGWGEDPRSYEDPAWIGRGPSTASQTAWALLGLHAAGQRSAAAERGIAWLASTQRRDGSWDEPEFTGTGFPGDFYINYHLYRLVFPVMALGRWCGDGTSVERATHRPQAVREPAEGER
ncbi:MAG: squalene--hopene cyclase [Solirubrobacterales bacterium]|nr:squalene--hopene cyclase [Solirubrobacterales bacterium]